MRAAAVLGLCLWATAARAQPSPSSVVADPYLIDYSRFESWSFFQPRAGADPTYSTFGNRATIGVRVSSARVDVDGSFQYAQLFGLPRRSIGPGPLGSGALYFDAARAPAAYQLYLKTISIRVKGLAPGLSITAGRMRYSSGIEAASDAAALEQLKEMRLRGRLIGGLEWTMFERSFDGVRIDLDRFRWALTGSILFPVQGGFEESANPTISSVRVIGVAATRTAGASGASSASGASGAGCLGCSGAACAGCAGAGCAGAGCAGAGCLGCSGAAGAACAGAGCASAGCLWCSGATSATSAASASETQLFAQHYFDHRDVLAPPDNFRSAPARTDLRLFTIGASHVARRPAMGGEVDVLFWGAGQAGDWSGRPHRAYSVAGEAGYRWTSARWEPWLRGGVLYASGDDDPHDGRHSTFFAGIPTVRWAMSATYAPMNVRDWFGEIRLHPRERVTVAAAVHRVDLASSADLWYSGSGATARKGAYFGYSGRTPLSNITGALEKDLATTFEGSADIALRPNWAMRVTAGIMKGGSVVKNMFAGDRLATVSIESTVHVW